MAIKVDMRSLAQNLHGIASQCDDIAQHRPDRVAEVYKIAFCALYGLAVEIEQTKPCNTRRRIALSFGRKTIVGLLQKHIEPTKYQLCVLVDGEYAIRYLWPNDATKEMY